MTLFIVKKNINLVILSAAINLLYSLHVYSDFRATLFYFYFHYYVIKKSNTYTLHVTLVPGTVSSSGQL